MNSQRVFFVDSSAFLALVNARDLFHKDAVRIKGRVDKLGYDWLTSNLVIHEVTALLTRKISRQSAFKFGDGIFAAGEGKIVWSDVEIERRAWGIYRHSRDATLSLVDCVSFVIMEEFGVRHAFSFDKHFVERGFQMIS